MLEGAEPTLEVPPLRERFAEDGLTNLLRARRADGAYRLVELYAGWFEAYEKTVEVPGQWVTRDSETWLALGDVKDFAVVSVNGREAGTAWHAPYGVDVTDYLKPGSNLISIKVINGWANRLIGDQQPDATTKYTFSTWKSYRANSQLQQSGLLGPVFLSKTSKP